jgi:low affinity Fe/Cu permease
VIGLDWESLVPPIVAVAAVAVWVLFPRMRRNGLLRFALILSVAVTALEVMATVLIFGVFFLSGGMENF